MFCSVAFFFAHVSRHAWAGNPYNSSHPWPCCCGVIVLGDSLKHGRLIFQAVRRPLPFPNSWPVDLCEPCQSLGKLCKSLQGILPATSQIMQNYLHLTVSSNKISLLTVIVNNKNNSNTSNKQQKEKT
ncbi:unnamed protein product, partial [Polarella glacialis]